MDELGTSDEDAGAGPEDTPTASEPVHWGRAVAGVVVAVLGVLPLLAGIAVFIWGMTVDEVCWFGECNPVTAGGRGFAGFVGVLLVTLGIALLEGASWLLFRKSLLDLVAWWAPDSD